MANLFVHIAACLELQCLPEGAWRCPCCVDKFCPDRKVAQHIRIQLTRAVKAPESEIGGCVVCRYVVIRFSFFIKCYSSDMHVSVICLDKTSNIL